MSTTYDLSGIRRFGSQEFRRGQRGKAWWRAWIVDREGKQVGACLHEHRSHARADDCARQMLEDRIASGLEATA